jgi:hypothetical protein
MPKVYLNPSDHSKFAHKYQLPSMLQVNKKGVYKLIWSRNIGLDILDMRKKWKSGRLVLNTSSTSKYLLRKM